MMRGRRGKREEKSLGTCPEKVPPRQHVCGCHRSWRGKGKEGRGGGEGREEGSVFFASSNLFIGPVLESMASGAQPERKRRKEGEERKNTVWLFSPWISILRARRRRPGVVERKGKKKKKDELLTRLLPERGAA